MHRILVVEDDPDTLELYTKILEKEYEVVTASGGESALEKISPGIDLILLDRRMPGIHGDEVLRKIKSGGSEIVDIPVIIVTAIEPDLSVIDLPFTDYLHKPIDADDLKLKVRNALAIKDYSSLLSRAFELINKRSTLRSMLDEEEITEYEGYQDLEEEISLVKKELDGRATEIMEGVRLAETKEFMKILKYLLKEAVEP